ncbi:cytochrome c oxidase subunit II [Exilibacterium tricleocarpae]|uniref:Cytochrome c oxidase subunit 2 n=1 Tax=Exilibacterium tricleocarpae TaxID=2591008 RepID=A0A545T0I4_9GAMM|nr:cytochrome c oxidase subunit II [Exilibacterium tricleocarpae]TQV70710.1 cytochrome c oxidase subunit II [Exilibacterium tricleocarpae]
MLNRAKRLFALLLGPAVLISISGQSLAEEVERWGLNMPRGVTPVSREVYDLHMLIFWICVVIGILVFGVMFYSMIVHRKSRGVKPANFHESTKLEILWTAVPFLILMGMAWPATNTLIKIYDTSESEVDILITGYQWKWKYEYVNQDVSFFSNLSTPVEQIRNLAPKDEEYLLEVDEPVVIPINKKVRFLITANDVIHAWWVPDLAVKKDAIPGYINETWTYVEEPGVYRGQCAELCGKDHGFMPIVVEALPEAEYEQWLAGKRQEAAKLRELTNQTFSFDELYEKGEQVYLAACAACHQANGQGVPPTFPAIAGSAYATGPIANHLSIIVNGSPTNPAMRAFDGELSEVDIAAVVTYQRNAFNNNMGDSVQPIDILKFKQGQ